MNTIIVLCAILGVAIGAPRGGYSHQAAYVQAPLYHVSAPAQPAYVQPQLTEVVKSGPIITGTLHHSQDTYGQYKYGYSSSDGQDKNEARESDGSVDGQFSYTSPEGLYVKLAYEADKGGFRAIGDHLPAAPEMPEELALAYQESHDRLAQAYEEARLRGDVYTPGEEEEEHRAKAPAPAVYPTYTRPAVVAPPSVHYKTVSAPVQALYIPAPAPVPVRYVPAPAAPAPAPRPKTYYAPAPAAPAPSYYAPAAEKERDEESKGPVPYLSSSYSTEIGGPVAHVAKAPAPAAPSKSAYY